MTSGTRSGFCASPDFGSRHLAGWCWRRCSCRTARSQPRNWHAVSRSTSPRSIATSSCSSATAWSGICTSATRPVSTSSSGEHEVEYLYCERCARVTAVSPVRLDPIRAEIQDEFGYTPRFTHFAIVGTCRDCLAALASEPQGAADQSSSARRRAPAPGEPTRTRAPEHEQLHSHGDYVHAHVGRAKHTH